MKIFKRILLPFAFSTSLLVAAIPQNIGYQGVAYENGLAVTSSISVRFTILKSDDETVVYQETKSNITPSSKGFFSHSIGTGTKSTDSSTFESIIWNNGYQLQIEADYSNGTSFTIIGIQPFSSVPYALNGLNQNNINITGTNANAFGQDNNASGYISIAMGGNTNSTGSYSTTMGTETLASGHSCVAMGKATRATADFATAMGRTTTASGYASTSIGYQTIADQDNMLAIGQYNTEDNTNTLFAVGNGTDDNNRSDAFTILNNGTVKIKNTTDAGNATGDTGGMIYLDDTANSMRIDVNQFVTTNSKLFFGVSNGTTEGYFDGTWNESSDRELKENIEIETGILEKIMKLEVVHYNFKTDSRDDIEIGFIAQDVEQYFPSLVGELYKNSLNKNTKTLSYSRFGVLAIGAIKELKKENDELKKELSDLKQSLKDAGIIN